MHCTIADRYKNSIYNCCCILFSEIITTTYDFQIGSGLAIERANYPVDGCHDDAEVLRRARARHGETCYHVLWNFARAFPRWCKTGYGGLTHDDAAANDRYQRALRLAAT